MEEVEEVEKVSWCERKYSVVESKNMFAIIRKKYNELINKKNIL